MGYLLRKVAEAKWRCPKEEAVSVMNAIAAVMSKPVGTQLP